MDRYAVLRIRDFRLSLVSKFFVALGLQMQAVVIGWQIYQLTHDPLALGLIGLAEALPFMGLSLWAGHYTDHHEKRRIIVWTEGGLVGCTFLLMALTAAGNRSPWLIYGVIGLTGVFRSFLWPASSTYIDMTVPQRIYSQAAGWNSTLWQVGAIVGPILGGWVYALSDAFHAYGVMAGLLLMGVLFATRLHPKWPVRVKEESGMAQLWGGIRFVFSHQPILAALSLDMFAVLFGGAVILLPIFAERLGVGPSGLGLLRAAPAVGALGVALYQSHRPVFKRTGVALLTAVAIFGLCMILFPLSKSFVLSLLLLAASGGADNVSVVIRASILQAMTPDHLRGRVSSVNGLFIGSSNEIGAFESGVAAKWLGTVPSVVLGGIMTWVSVAVAAWAAPQLRRLRLESVQGLEGARIRPVLEMPQTGMR